MSPRLIPALLAGACLGLSGCNGMQLQTREPGYVPGTGPFPSPGVGGNTPQTREGRPAGRTSQVCRGEKAPKGYVIVSYVSQSGACGAGMKQDAEANVALLTQIDGLEYQTVLVACADQFVPRGWERIAPEDGDDSNSSCPRLRSDRKTGPTVMRIRKQS